MRSSASIPSHDRELKFQSWIPCLASPFHFSLPPFPPSLILGSRHLPPIHSTINAEIEIRHPTSFTLDDSTICNYWTQASLFSFFRHTQIFNVTNSLPLGICNAIHNEWQNPTEKIKKIKIFKPNSLMHTYILDIFSTNLITRVNSLSKSSKKIFEDTR